MKKIAVILIFALLLCGASACAGGGAESSLLDPEWTQFY